MLMAALLARIALAAASAAQQPAAAMPARWISSWDHGECLLTRAVGNPPAERLSIKVTPGSNVIGVFVSDPANSRTPRGSPSRASIVLAPSGLRIEGANLLRYRNEGNVVHAFSLPEQAALDAFASAVSIQIEIDGTRSVDMPLGNVAAGIDVLRQCMNDQLRSWGIDPSTLAALSRRPRASHPGGPAGFFMSGDYPAAALRAHQSGQTTVRLDIGPDGRVISCGVLASSGHRSLDDRTCLILSRRARFEPALDAAGAPTAAPFVTRVRWNAPE
jgi:TonB family protein